MKKRLIPEALRIQENHLGTISIWDFWGPFVPERVWGIVREDYSKDGDSWNYFTYDMARTRVPRWGEDGIAGICDRYQTVSLSFAFWNHNDPHLKERLFGLTPNEGNHGEDVKELYFHLENVPSHAYMKYLYKYPQNEFPYQKLIDENKKRTRQDPEYEIYDTGIFKEKRYFDIYIEFAKINPNEIVIKIEAFNRGPEEAVLDIIPQLTFRNIWSWKKDSVKKPKLWKEEHNNASKIVFDDLGAEAFPMLDVEYQIGRRYLYTSPDALSYFTENETNYEALGLGTNKSPYVRDAFHRKIVSGENNVVNPANEGTRACFHFKDLKIPAGSSQVRYIRLASLPLLDPLANIDSIIEKRKAETDGFYSKLLNTKATEEEKMIQRRAISAQLWNKQLYLFIVNQWLMGDEVRFPDSRTDEGIRNLRWRHLVSKHIILMPDKWEYPWFAAWDLSFHSLTVALYDLQLAKDQLSLLITEQFQHPNGQIPACEWEFCNLNPPIQATCLLMLYAMEKEQTGKGDLDFLEKCFGKLMINFVWWVNRQDSQGLNIFEGGFLGLDNIGVIDRSKPIPGGGVIEQSDGTGWMGLFCIHMMRIAFLLTRVSPNYTPMVTKFFQHFIYIASALNNCSKRGVQNWDDEDGFFYDVLSFQNGKHQRIPVRSLVGIIPFFAIEGFYNEELKELNEFYEKLQWFEENRPDLLQNCVYKTKKNGEDFTIFSLVPVNRIERVLKRISDPNEFRSEFGLRSLSKIHQSMPYKIFDSEISYTPGESTISMFGGNSNWRGPIWMPMNYLLFKNLKKMHSLFGDDFKVDLGNGKSVRIKDIARDFGESAIKLFKKDTSGNRPIFEGIANIEDTGLNDQILFYEYFHGDSGKGLGASHQTGWTSLIANIIDELRKDLDFDARYDS